MSPSNSNAYPARTLWHDRFKQQLEWTRSTRDFVYRKLNFARCTSFLELGCGTGALLEEIATRFIVPRVNSGKEARLVGIDINKQFLAQSREILQDFLDQVEIKEADAHDLPFPASTFDIVYCHYFLMWNSPGKRAEIIAEARRVLRDGGWLVILAEPDYQGWILEPNTPIKDMLLHSLTNSGGDLESGRKIPRDLAGFKDVAIDCCSKAWTSTEWEVAFDTEWNFFESLLSERAETAALLARLKKEDKDIIVNRAKFAFLPVIFGLGRK
jgi:SAM-dependent methyltransferase